MLKENRVQVHQPTLHPNQDELIVGKVRHANATFWGRVRYRGDGTDTYYRITLLHDLSPPPVICDVSRCGGPEDSRSCERDVYRYTQLEGPRGVVDQRESMLRRVKVVQRGMREKRG